MEGEKNERPHAVLLREQHADDDGISKVPYGYIQHGTGVDASTLRARLCDELLWLPAHHI
jgi:hypothetical protein